MSEQGKLVKSVIDSLSKEEKNILNNDNVMIIKASISSKIFSYKIVNITEENIGDLWETCSELKNRHNGFIILTRMDHIHNIVHVNIDGEMSVMNDFDEFYTITDLSENIFRQHTDRIVNYKNKDIDIVMKQTSCTMEEALDALNKNDNDIVNAIMYVQGY